MNIAFLVNNCQELKVTQTTSMLIKSALRLAERVWVVEVCDLGFDHKDRVFASCRELRSAELSESARGDRAVFLKELNAKAKTRQALAAAELFMMRTNPARDTENDWAHRASLDFAQILQADGVKVVNSPQGLLKASSKLYLAHFVAEIQPLSLVSHHKSELLEFVHEHGDCVIKPLQGTRGRHVFRLRAGLENTHAMIDAVLSEGLALIQNFVPGAEQGDTRLLMLDGQVLEIDGVAAGIRRVPAKGDFRSNLHAGGQLERMSITPTMLKTAEAIGPQLVKDGLRLVGLDLIGDTVIELNVFSTGGLYGAEQHTGFDYCKHILESFIQN